jgi:hypothetical protein
MEYKTSNPTFQLLSALLQRLIRISALGEV